MTRFTFAAGFLATILWPTVGAAQPKANPSQADFFEAKVRPLLAQNCFECHGPKKQRGGLRLDGRSAILKGGETGPALVPGDPEKSLVLKAVKQTGDLKMPPKKKLAAQDVAILTAWIKLGAPWPEGKTSAVAAESEAWMKHWAFRPIASPPVPATKDKDWPLTDIDRFLLAKLEAAGLKPSAQAERRMWIRRVTFDLIGLPPTPEEIDAFEKDAAPDAFGKVVDRLLASPHYGERWGRYWLDIARYADTKGYVFFEDEKYAWAWTYRDYVIRAFNEDLPYDRFILEQLAADKLPLGDDKRPLAGLGFLTVGGRFMSNQHDILDDRIDVATRGLMGLTVTCARCHDHKYDPISSKDYYSLYGVFGSCGEPDRAPLLQRPPKTDVYAKFDKELQVREKMFTDFVKAKHDELVQSARSRVAEYMMAAHALRGVPSTDEFMLLADGGELNPTMIARWKGFLDRRAKQHDSVLAPWFAFVALPEKDFAKDAAGLAGKLGADPAKPIHPQVAALFAKSPPGALADVAKRYGSLLNEVYARWQVLPRLGLPLTPGADERRLLEIFEGSDAPPNVAHLPYGNLSLLPDRPSQGKYTELRKALENWRATGPGAPPRAMALEDFAAPIEPHVFLRGNPHNLGEKVPRRLPLVLGGPDAKPFTQGSGRLEFARAIAGRDNSLTARVLVNRVWLHHFGAGLVRTPSDFGLRSDPPSHPELLDHLATWFMDNGWSLKKLHRLIVLSRVYQQRSDDRPDGNKIDPENRLLWKMNRGRLDFEATRDALLFVTGRLDKTVGGPSVDDFLTAAGNRRTLYSYLNRLNVPGLFRTFDFPSPDATSPGRDTTTVAPQALFLMNHPFVLGCAKAVAGRNDIAGEKDAARTIDRLHRLLYGRPAAAEEIDLGRAYLQDAGNSVLAWERYIHALMLANEFVIVD